MVSDLVLCYNAENVPPAQLNRLTEECMRVGCRNHQRLGQPHIPRLEEKRLKLPLTQNLEKEAKVAE